MKTSTRIGLQHAAAFTALLLGQAGAVLAQTPRISTFFPIGGQTGKTVEVEIRGSSLEGASQLLVHGTGVTGTVGVSGGNVDEAGKQVWQAKCSTCHELRSPANRSMTSAQWAATIDRMIKVRQAPINAAEATKINAYILSQARNGRLSAEIKIADDAMPGIYELRVVTAKGVSTVGLFEVGNLPEVIAVNNTRQTAPTITLPCVANGCLSSDSERHYFRFNAKKGQRLVFNFKGFRYKEESVLFFNPDLRLYDSSGTEIAENHGYYDLDPLIDWTCPVDGPYTIEVRDLLGRGNPGSVYRLTMGAVPYDTFLYPSAAQEGTKPALHVVGKNTGAVETNFTMPIPTEAGVKTIGSPFGPETFFITPYPVVTDQSIPSSPVKVPGAFSGRIAKAGEVTTFPIIGEGRMEFELYSGRIGSPGNMALTLVGPDGKGMGRVGNDQRFEANLEAGKTYSLKVDEASGKSGEDFTYAVEARSAHPHLEVVARPASINLRPGLSTYVEIITTRRDGVVGDINIHAENLPPGVTALPASIVPDRNDTFLILTASPNAKPVQGPIRIVASGGGPLGPTTVKVQPQEIYYMQNQPRPLDRAENVVAVRGDAEFLAAFASNDPIKVHPRKVTEVKVKLLRKTTFKGNISARIEGLPRGWVCYQETVGADKDEMTLLIRPNGDDTRPFLNRDPKMTPIRCILVANSDEFQWAMGMAIVIKSDQPDDEKSQ